MNVILSWEDLAFSEMLSSCSVRHRLNATMLLQKSIQSSDPYDAISDNDVLLPAS